jgi:hypothetical protein
MSTTGMNLNGITANTLLATTFAQGVYLAEGSAQFQPPTGFEKVESSQLNFTPTPNSGFAAETYYNKVTGQVVIAYRGSDTVGEALGVAARAATTGYWDPQFTDATNYAVQAKAAALVQINAYRRGAELPEMTSSNLTPLLTGHSLGGLLAQVVSKMFGYPAEVLDSLGAGRLVTTAEFQTQARALNQVDAQGNVLDFNVSDKVVNYATSGASNLGIQLGSTVDIPALGQIGGVATLLSVAAAFFVPLVGAGVFATQQLAAKHNAIEIERAMYGLAALKPLLADAGELRSQSMSLEQAQGTIGDPMVPGPNVVGLVNGQGQVVAYIDRDQGNPRIVVMQGAATGTQLLLGPQDSEVNGALTVTRINPDNSVTVLTKGQILNTVGGIQTIKRTDTDGDGEVDTETTTTSLSDENGDGQIVDTQNYQDGEVVGHEAQTYDEFGNLTERTVYNESGSGDWAALTATYTNGEISSLAADMGSGATHSLDLLTLTPTERQSYGFHTQQEVASRLEQLGLADGFQFMTDGFAATGAQNAGLNDLQVDIGGTQYIWNNNWADLNLTNGGGWNAAGNGALASPGAPYCAAPVVSQSILYMGGAKNHLSPLVLDLDGDGVATDLTHAYDGGRVFFDIDADGFAERVGWVNPDDGLLAMDVNGNGRIDDITELYGDDQMPAFQKLRNIDTNGDNRIDANDAAFAALRIWQDANQDGITQDGELKTLASLDIQSISTNDHNDTRWANENYISSSTTYTRLENGVAVEREIADVHFLNDNANTWQLGAHSQVYGSDIQIDLEAILLPLSRGYGDLPSLHLAMSANAELKRMVRELAYLPLDRLNEAAARIDDIMLEWAGVRGNDPASHATGDGPRIDGRKVDFVERFTGLTWAQRGTTSMVGEDASVGLKKTWNGIEAALMHRLVAQGALRAVLPNASYDFATDAMVLNESMSEILARARSLAPADTEQAREFWTQLGGILIEGKDELGQSVAAINAAVSTEAGQNLYLGEHLIAPSNSGDPDWGLYTGDGTASEVLVGGIQVGDAAGNALRGSGAGEYFFGGRTNVRASDGRRMKSRRWRYGVARRCAAQNAMLMVVV